MLSRPLRGSRSCGDHTGGLQSYKVVVLYWDAPRAARALAALELSTLHRTATPSLPVLGHGGMDQPRLPNRGEAQRKCRESLSRS